MQDLFAVQYSFLIPLLPLLGAIAAGFFGARWLKGKSHWPIWIGVLGAAIISFALLFGMLSLAGDHHPGEQPTDGSAQLVETIGFTKLTAVKSYFTWIKSGPLDVKWGYFFDPLTAVMLCVVCGIGFLITVFAAGYMKGEVGYFRFFAYLGLFIFMMTNLVMGENLIMLYLGWEGVGLCSYLLIGYYYDKPAAREAAKKAFLVNRVGDFGFGLGIMLCFMAFGTVSYFGPTVMPNGPADGLLELAIRSPEQMTPFQQQAMAWIPFLLMLGAFGKSAQFPLYVWLPDAMEGPTPVSALIHAATMVTAGVYMIARCSTLFVGNAASMWTIAVIGTFTAIFAATIALRQFDLKKVFAYSTISQLGFMFVGVGVFAPVAGVFHLITHAFFKALLFLSSGVVMHAMAGELDMRKFSGLKRQLPKTRWLMLIGCAALAGFPVITSGYWSKDEIIHYAHGRSLLLYLFLSVAAFMTAYYTFRLYFRVFEGPEVLPEAPAHGHGHGHDDHGHGAAHGHDSHKHADHGHHNHEPMIMIAPLALLAVGAIFAGALNFPWSHHLGHFLGQSPSFYYGYTKARALFGDAIDPIAFGQPAKAEFHAMPLVIGGLIALAGILVAYVLHLRDRRKAEELAQRLGPVVNVIDHKYWVDEIYQAAIVEPLRALGRVFFAMDRIVVDGLVWLISFIPQASGFALKLTTQRGYLQGYAVTMLLGIAVILIVVFL